MISATICRIARLAPARIGAVKVGLTSRSVYAGLKLPTRQADARNSEGEEAEVAL